MQRGKLEPGKRVAAWVVTGLLIFAMPVAADNDWEFNLELYGWLPIIETENEAGNKSEITRDDILDDLDLFGFSFVRVKKGKWSLSSDFVYFDISQKTDVPLFGEFPDLAELDKAGMQAWVIRPAIGYEVYRADRQFVELYAGGRYLWIEADLKFDIDPILPGEPSSSRKDSPSESNWDGIVGARGSYWLNDKWFLPYSVNAGTGQSDFTWEAQAAVGYRLENLDAALGWRYLYYDIGSDTLLKELTVNGPFAGVMFHW
jgi:hypothetical protein